jgi:hypothetical protein
MAQLTKDANGNLVGPPDVLAKAQAYARFREEQADALMTNPFKFMNGFIEKRATAIAERIIGERMRSNQDQQGATTFIQNNMQWLYEIDPQTGRPRQQLGINPQTGQQQMFDMLSPWGQKFRQYATEVNASQGRRGYHDEAEIQSEALRRVQFDFAMQELADIKAGRVPITPANPAEPPKTPQQKSNDDFLNKHNPPGARQPGGGNTTPEPPKITKQNLRQIMLQEMAAQGITDQTLGNAS